MIFRVSTAFDDEINVYISTISWDAPCGDVNSYAIYYSDDTGSCKNETFGADIRTHKIDNLYQMQIVTHRTSMTDLCSPGMYTLVMILNVRQVCSLVMMILSSLPNPKAFLLE